MPKYFLRFSYIGSRFSGSQIQPDHITVQGVLESILGMILVSPEGKEPRLHISSRTDAGVHALMNAATFVLDEEKPHEPSHLMLGMNKMLNKMEMEIRVNECRTVSPGFSARAHARERSYLYRLAILKPQFDSWINYAFTNPEHQIPVTEFQRVWPLRSGFDYRRFRQAADILQGCHNFASFMTKSANSDGVPVTDTEKNILHIGIEVGRPLIDPEYCPSSGRFDFIDTTFVSKSFLYNQIRRMIACLVGVAQHRMNVADVRWLLEQPDPINFSKFRLRKAPSTGLYLKQITYNEEDFDDPRPFIGKNREEEM